MFLGPANQSEPTLKFFALNSNFFKNSSENGNFTTLWLEEILHMLKNDILERLKNDSGAMLHG